MSEILFSLLSKSKKLCITGMKGLPQYYQPYNIPQIQYMQTKINYFQNGLGSGKCFPKSILNNNLSSVFLKIKSIKIAYEQS